MAPATSGFALTREWLLAQEKKRGGDGKLTAPQLSNVLRVHLKKTSLRPKLSTYIEAVDAIIGQDPAIVVHWGNIAAGEETDLTEIDKAFIKLLKAGLISIPDESVLVVEKPATKTKKRSAPKKDHRQPDDPDVDDQSSDLSDLPPADDKSDDDDDDSDEDHENGKKKGNENENESQSGFHPPLPYSEFTDKVAGFHKYHSAYQVFWHIPADSAFPPSFEDMLGGPLFTFNPLSEELVTFRPDLAPPENAGYVHLTPAWGPSTSQRVVFCIKEYVLGPEHHHAASEQCSSRNRYLVDDLMDFGPSLPRFCAKNPRFTENVVVD
ncbi:hypothetical protein R3P38DRAFT_3193197 [Favolaschia claudopus]|uniref:Uncharacterized protein n=1 Tax=Favolaschia claudopus TaxID=2862362 RepID=A0AAW0BIE8_9AGAR